MLVWLLTDGLLPHPLTPSPTRGEGEQICLPAPALGEGLGERARIRKERAELKKVTFFVGLWPPLYNAAQCKTLI